MESGLEHLLATLRDVVRFKHPALSVMLFSLGSLIIFNLEITYHVTVHHFLEAHPDLLMVATAVEIGVLGVIIALTLRLATRPTQLDEFKEFNNLRESLKRRRFRCKIISDPADLEAANLLTAKIFGERTPGDHRVNAVFRKNNRKSILIAERDEGQVRAVGFASAWPVKDDIGLLLSAGKMAESELMPADVLPVAQNKTAKYLYVPGIAVDKARVGGGDKASHGVDASVDASSTRETGARSTILVVNFLDLLLNEFVVDDDIRKIVMIADSSRGLNYMMKFAAFVRKRAPGAVSETTTNHAGATAKVMTIDVDHNTIRDLRDQVLRRLAGVQSGLETYHRGGFWDGAEA